MGYTLYIGCIFDTHCILGEKKAKPLDASLSFSFSLPAPFCLLQENNTNSEVVEQIYRRNPILRYTQHPLHSPLLPLPYGDVGINSK